ncbi:hypothetical protein Q8F55_007479 [Vanrija albida]|uniref:Uncharacterized protein n=1 Tax=Vanrija albida TaxID=181172 RepID=A0ABR3PUI7_9TREE
MSAAAPFPTLPPTAPSSTSSSASGSTATAVAPSAPRSAPTSPTQPLAAQPARSHSAPAAVLDIFDLTSADVDAWLEDNVSPAGTFVDPVAAPLPTKAREPTPEEQVLAILDDIAAEIGGDPASLYYEAPALTPPATITPLALVGAPPFYPGAVVPPPRQPAAPRHAPTPTPPARRHAAKPPSPLRNTVALASSSSSPVPSPRRRAKRAAPQPGGFTFVNFTVADGDELSAGVAPSGGKGRKGRDEDEEAGGSRKRRKA